MNIKINWGWGVVIALASFMIFIGTIVFQLMFKKEYDHQLVSENYYKDELLFQLELNKLENAKKLPKNILVQPKDGKLLIIFPEAFNFSEIEGTINFQYIIDDQFDFEQKIALKTPIFEVDSLKLKKGSWNLKVDWKYRGAAYLYKEKIHY
ncbi:MAG: FixH family protein [Flavobacteriaceae bacterium]|nr:FixH family protein [Flavobacteriaceae bacterium]